MVKSSTLAKLFLLQKNHSINIKGSPLIDTRVTRPVDDNSCSIGDQCRAVNSPIREQILLISRMSQGP